MSRSPTTTDLEDGAPLWEAVRIAERLESPPADGVIRQPDVGRLAGLEPKAALGALDRLLASTAPADGLRHLEATGALSVLLPEVAGMVDFHLFCPVHHKDLWAHTLQVIEQTPSEGDLRWVALMHDAGKVLTRAVTARGKVTFLRHEQVGAALMVGVGARLQMDAGRVDHIRFVIEHHGRLNAYEPTWTDRAIRRLIRDAGDHMEALLSFSAADYTTGRSSRRNQIVRRAEELRSRIEHLESQATAPVLPAGFAQALIDDLDLTPGPAVGETLRWLEGEIRSERLAAETPIAELIAAAKLWRSQGV